jgi:hypothetical protein
MVGRALIALGRGDEAVDFWMRSRGRRALAADWATSDWADVLVRSSDYSRARAFKLRHDAEQYRHVLAALDGPALDGSALDGSAAVRPPGHRVASSGVGVAAAAAAGADWPDASALRPLLAAEAERFDAARAAVEAPGGEAALSSPGTGPVWPMVRRTFGREVVWSPLSPAYALEPGERALSPALDAAAVERAFFGSEPHIAFVDGLLTPRALARVRAWLREASVWHEVKPTRGYLGAYMDDGLANPLLLRIAREIQETFPSIFKGLELHMHWAYKYDSGMKQGISVHADQAAVNLNVWITEDEANLDAESGGLVVFHTPAPRDMPPQVYNDEGKLGVTRAMLERDGFANTTVPHRANRMVLFQSDLFHRTDDFAFRDARYEDRRINLTYLYGERL